MRSLHDNWDKIIPVSVVILFDKEKPRLVQSLTESTYHLAFQLLCLWDKELELNNTKFAKYKQHYSEILSEKFEVLLITPWPLKQGEYSELEGYGVVPSSVITLPSLPTDFVTSTSKHKELKNLVKSVSLFMNENGIAFHIVAVHPGNMITPTKMSLLGNALFWITKDAVLLFDQPISPSSARNLLHAIHRYHFTKYSLLIEKTGCLRKKPAHFAIVTSREAYISEGLLDFGSSMLNSRNNLDDLISNMARNAKEQGWRVREIET